MQEPPPQLQQPPASALLRRRAAAAAASDAASDAALSAAPTAATLADTDAPAFEEFEAEAVAELAVRHSGSLVKTGVEAAAQRLADAVQSDQVAGGGQVGAAAAAAASCRLIPAAPGARAAPDPAP